MVILLFLAAASSRASLDSGPDNTILLSSFENVLVVDSFAIAVATQGVAVYQYDNDSAAFDFKDQLLLKFTQATMKRFGDTLVVNADKRILYFVDISSLPRLTLVGRVDVGQDFGDFTVHGTDLYVSEWFQGIWRYHLHDYNSATFADSSMKGILVSQLQITNDTMYVLDEYNGILRYDLGGFGFGQFIDYLYVPFRVSSFVQYDSLFCLLLRTGGVYFGDFDESGGKIVDSIPSIPTPLRAYVTHAQLLVLTQRQMFKVDRTDFSSITAVDIPDQKLDGDLFHMDSDDYLLLPGLEGGLSLFNLATGASPLEGLYRSGMLSDLFIYQDRLFTSGLGNPVDVWKICDSTQVHHDYTVLPEIGSTSFMAHNGDSLIVLYPDFQKIGVILNSLNPDSLSLENAFSVGSTPVRSLQLARNRIHKFETLIVDRPDYLDAYILADSGYVTYINRWGFIDKVVCSQVVDTFLYVVLAKRELLVYSITKDFTRHLVADVGLSGTTLSLYAHNDQLYIFGTDRLTVLDISDPPSIHPDTSIDLPFRVTEFGGIRRQPVYCRTGWNHGVQSCHCLSDPGRAWWGERKSDSGGGWRPGRLRRKRRVSLQSAPDLARTPRSRRR